jgi:hypothetical protein
MCTVIDYRMVYWTAFQVLPAIDTNNSFWDITLCSPLQVKVLAFWPLHVRLLLNLVFKSQGGGNMLSRNFCWLPRDWKAFVPETGHFYEVFIGKKCCMCSKTCFLTKFHAQELETSTSIVLVYKISAVSLSSWRLCIRLVARCTSAFQRQVAVFCAVFLSDILTKSD